MAIINTLEKCLDSPFLFHDPEAPARVPELLTRAACRLEDARLLAANAGTGDPADITLSSYEAKFACVRALVYQKGYREAGLRCLLLACEKLYVLGGDLDPALFHKFEKAQGLSSTPVDALAAAEAWYERTTSLLSDRPA